jgi:hypothetical protein
MSFNEARALKQGLISERVIREKKDICKTAIISTPIIFPEIRPNANNTRAMIATALANLEITPSSYETYCGSV